MELDAGNEIDNVRSSINEPGPDEVRVIVCFQFIQCLFKELDNPNPMMNTLQRIEEYIE